MRMVWVLLCCVFPFFVQAQQGSLRAVVNDSAGQALSGASAQLSSLSDTARKQTAVTDGAGAVSFSGLKHGYYRLRVSYTGFQPLVIDSLQLHEQRNEIALPELSLKRASAGMLEAIVVYTEKPLIQTRDGNITFNAGESAASQGSNAGDLLTQVPLVTKDANGRLLVRGKEPRILIDDKPVELNLQQLQDLLESLPGSAIEKIEVMTNPPPQYANEPGGVINITTRKGTAGFSSRLTVFGGSRGEAGTNGSLNYRKNSFVLGVNAGLAANAFDGWGYTVRQNIYSDSVNFLKTRNDYVNRSLRPSLRINIDYNFTKAHLLNVVLQYNENRFDNDNLTWFENINRFDQLYRLSQRNISGEGANRNSSLAFTYTYKTRKPGEVFRLFGNYTYTDNKNDRLFYQQFFQPDYSFTGNDTTQWQLTNNLTRGYTVRGSYDKPFANKKTSLSAGGFVTHTFSDVAVDALYRPKGGTSLLALDLLSNFFLFQQTVSNLRSSVKHLWTKNFSTTAGVAVEETAVHFDLLKTGQDSGHQYRTVLPFANLNRNWESGLNLTLSYRRTLRRPGINELNPTRDFSDPYNIRAGNPNLLPSPAHNFDLVAGRTKGGFYLNLGTGYNIVEDIFSPIRTLIGNGVTETIWQNVSARKEYELSTWSGYTVSRQLRLSMSASYTHNRYGDYDKTVRRFRDGGSLTTNLTTNYTPKDLYNATGSFTFNRFANPQGTVRNSVSMNLAAQAKLWKKKLVLTLTVIDPIFQQENHSFTYGPNFVLENFNFTQTRNYRLSIGYSFSKTLKAPAKISRPAGEKNGRA